MQSDITNFIVVNYNLDNYVSAEFISQEVKLLSDNVYLDPRALFAPLFLLN